MKKFYASLLFMLTVSTSWSQCAEGEITLTMNIYTDPWPYETYWQITPANAGCGNDVIAEGANVNVNCSGTTADNGPNGYDANTVYNVGPFCLTEGEYYDLIFVDSYGDGGLVFEVFENGQLTHVYTAGGWGNIWMFQAGAANLPVYDQPCGAAQVEVDGAALVLNNENAIAAVGELAPPAGSCAVYGFWCEGNSSNSVWATFTPTEGVTYEITTCNPENVIDTQLALWKATDCTDFSTFELISSNDDMFGGCDISTGYASLMYGACLDPNATYFIQADGWAGEVGDIAITVSTISSPLITLEAQVNNERCPLDKGEQGSASIYPYINQSGANFDCVWSGPDGFSSTENSIYDLNAGTYTATVTDACGNSATDSFQISQPEGWNVSVSITDPNCMGSDDGAIDVTTQGATFPYEFSWVGPGGYNSQFSDISGLMIGTYNLSITDDNDCNYTAQFVLSADNSLTFDLGADTTVCQNASFVISAPVGYSYLWQDGSTNQFYFINAQDWGQGQHALILTISSPEGCVATDAYYFIVDDCVGVDENADIQFSCFPNPNNGSFTVHLQQTEIARIVVFDATGKQVFVQNTQNGESTVHIAANLAPGVYHVMVEQSGIRDFSRISVH